MDAAKLQDAIDYASTQASFAVRVYRNGCLVGEDRAAPVNRELQFESWSMAKSVIALIFGRAMTKGLIQPEDPVGSLVTEADREHGRITALAAAHDDVRASSGTACATTTSSRCPTACTTRSRSASRTSPATTTSTPRAPSRCSPR